MYTKDIGYVVKNFPTNKIPDSDGFTEFCQTFK